MTNFYSKRSLVDRRSLANRRIFDIEVHPGEEKRFMKKDRRRSWENRYGWERASEWLSAPIWSDLP